MHRVGILIFSTFLCRWIASAQGFRGLRDEAEKHKLLLKHFEES